MTSKADLHVHSRYSDRPTEWVLRRIGAPECYTPPRAVYDTARRRGMQFVTISDHNCIDGALEIAHLPGAFVSNEITTYFPDNGCKVHVLCWDITESQFADIQRLRSDIVALRDYLCAERIVHACAHPLYSINDRLTIGQFEQLVLLFDVFEVMNGGRHRRGNSLVRTILERLTREQFEDMANRHDVTILGDEPWRKGFTGGSDDHSGAFVAKGFTECPSSASPAEFLQHVGARTSQAGGLDGTPLSFAHSLYRISYQYYRDRFMSKSIGSGDLVLRVLGEIFGGEPTPVRFRDRVSYYAGRLRGRSEVTAEVEFKRMISTEMTSLFSEDWLGDDFVLTADRYEEINRRTFELSSRIANQLLFQFSRKFVQKLASGSVFGSLEALSAAGPLLLGVAPYLFSFAHQNRDKDFLSAVSQRFLGAPLEADATPKKAWFADALTDVNGVNTLVEQMCRLAGAHHHDLTLMSFGDQPPDHPNVRHFPPVGQFAFPENDKIVLAFPPFLDVLEYCERQQFNELIVSTPGLAGLAALAAGRLLNIRLVGIYHTDLPQYVRYYTDDDAMESATWRYLRWFYDQMEVIYVPSRSYREQLLVKGFAPEKLQLFPHGTDTERFHPRHRDPAFWERYGPPARLTITYVGRLAREKDLDVLVPVFDALARGRPDCRLAVVGDGPFLEAMQRQLPHANVVFTGFLFGDDLSTAYATSDVFVFPSTTDTFGNVVLEAMASGVPVVCSDKGGPSEIVEDGRTGLITRARNASDLLAAIEQLIGSAALRQQMSLACREYAEHCGWDRIYLDFWRGSGVDRSDQTPRAAASAS